MESEYKFILLILCAAEKVDNQTAAPSKVAKNPNCKIGRWSKNEDELLKKQMSCLPMTKIKIEGRDRKNIRSKIQKYVVKLYKYDCNSNIEIFKRKFPYYVKKLESRIKYLERIKKNKTK